MNSKKNNKKIIYIAGANVPSQAPNAIQTINMAYAFSKIQKDFSFVINFGIFTKSKKTIVADYNLKNLFFINLPCFFSVNPYRPKHYNNKLYNKIVPYYALMEKPYFVYTRIFEIAKRCMDLGIRTVLEYHNTIHQKINFRSKDLVALVTISDDLIDDFARNGIDKKRIIIEQDGVWHRRFDIRKSKKELRIKYGLPTGRKIFTYCGNLYSYKGIPLILDVAKNFKDELFLLVGGWPEDVIRVKKKIEEKKLSNVICFGSVKYKNIPELLSLSDILLLVNSGKHFMSNTTSPLKLFEYMASSVPVVAPRLKNIERVLNDGKNAILFTPDSVSDLTCKIKKVRYNQDLARKIAKQAKKDVKYYDWEKRAQRIMDKINKLI